MSALTTRLRTLAAAGLMASTAMATLPAHAYEAGDWIFKLGASDVIPHNTAGYKVSDDIHPSLSLTYMATRHIGIDLLGAWPFQHRISSEADGSRLAYTKQLPPTLSVQWHFLPDSRIQPFVGVGINYTHFFDTHGTGALSGDDVKLHDSWGPAGQAGVDIKLSEHWLMSADVRYIGISSRVSVDGSHLNTANLNPWVATVSVGYQF